jgi:hypothetical protein
VPNLWDHFSVFNTLALQNSDSSDVINSEEVKNALFCRKPNKAPGIDGISIELYRILMFDDVFISVLTRLFNSTFFGDVSPSEWNDAIITLLFKGKGDVRNPENYRGISLTPHLLKVYESVLTSRMQMWSNESSVLSKFQSAYRVRRGVDEQIFILQCLVDLAFLRNKKLYVCTIDLSKAFPSVNRLILFETLIRLGAPPMLVRALIMLYCRNRFSLLIDGKHGHFMDANMGVREGSISSPILFTLMFDAVVHSVFSVENDAPRIGDESYPILLYADDVILISNSKLGLQTSVASLENFCRDYGFKINELKCEFMIFEKSRRMTVESLKIGNLELKNIPVLRYLGIWFERNGKWSKHIELTVAKAKVASNFASRVYMKGPSKKVDFLVQILDTFVSSILRFGIHVWAVKPLGKLDSVRLNFLKKSLNLPKSTRHLSVLSEFGKCCMDCQAAYEKFCFYCRVMSFRELEHVKMIFLKSAEQSGSLVTRNMDLLHEYDLAIPILTAPEIAYSNRKKYFTNVMKICLERHVKNVGGLGFDTVYYSVHKKFGISGYVFSPNVNQVIFLFLFRTGTWKKVEGLRQYFLSPSERPLCPTCFCEMSSEHLFDECLKFDGIRESLKHRKNLSQSQSVFELFDAQVCDVDLLNFCKILSNYFHVLAGIKDSVLSKLSEKL